jgi:hypothetical protein
MSDDNVVEFTGEWQGEEMTDEEYQSAMEELLTTVDEDNLGRVVSGVLEFLTVKAIFEGPYYILTENKDAVTVFAANETVKDVLESLPDSVRPFDEGMEVPPFETNSDPGDEQDEPAPAS